MSQREPLSSANIDPFPQLSSSDSSESIGASSPEGSAPPSVPLTTMVSDVAPVRTSWVSRSLETGGGDALARLAATLPIQEGTVAVANALADALREATPASLVAIIVSTQQGTVVVTRSPEVEFVSSRLRRIEQLENPHDPFLENVPADEQDSSNWAGLEQTPTEVGSPSQLGIVRVFPNALDEIVSVLPKPFDRCRIHLADTTDPSLRTRVKMRALEDLADRAALILTAAMRSVSLGVHDEKRQLRELQARVVQSEKLASVGQIAANVVHELNNPLTAIVTYADYLVRKLDRGIVDPADVERARRIREAAERIQHFTRDLSAYARPTDEQLGLVSLKDIANRAKHFCEHIASPHGISVQVSVDDVCQIVGRRGQLTQVFVNLITNACHAILDIGRSDGRVEVSVQNQHNSGTRVIVADNGNGISPEHVVRVFDPFFTTKPEGRGTGLGLSIVRSIVEEHGGRVWVRSVLGQGTQFVLEFVDPPT